MFERIGPEFQCFKDKTKNLMGGSIRSEMQCLEGSGQNSHLSNYKVRIPVFGRIRSEFQCLER